MPVGSSPIPPGHAPCRHLNEGLGKSLRFGANGEEVLARLRWLASILGPALGAALQLHGPLDLKPLIAQALHMGDECHNRNIAASCLLLRRLVPAFCVPGRPRRGRRGGRLHRRQRSFFLNLSMAACKAMLDAAHGVAGAAS